MVSNGLDSLGYQVQIGFRIVTTKYLNIDDGWASGRHPNGTIIPDPEKFPSGIASLAAYVHCTIA